MIALIKKLVQWIRTFLRVRFNSQNPELPYYVAIVVALVFFGIALKGFIEITDELAENELGEFDAAITDWVISFRSDGLTSYFRFMTEIGDRYAYVTITILLGAYFFFRLRNWKFVVQTIAVLLLATLSNVLIKQVINRQRPTLEHLVSVNTLSYPSGHSMSAMAFYGFLIYLCTQMKMPVFVRVFFMTLLTIIILSVGVSRIYLGVHFPSDVAAGFLGGLLWVTLCVIIFNTVSLWRKRKLQ
jgi:membrane-associated phospholipid phosphatase